MWLKKPAAVLGDFEQLVHYAMEPAGQAALEQVYRTFKLMTAGFERRLERA
jgi:hypothetical protein